jgi:hypothetical protein
MAMAAAFPAHLIAVDEGRKPPKARDGMGLQSAVANAMVGVGEGGGEEAPGGTAETRRAAAAAATAARGTDLRCVCVCVRAAARARGRRCYRCARGRFAGGLCRSCGFWCVCGVCVCA